MKVPALPGCVTQGETVEEALMNAREAIEAYVLSLKDRGLEIPGEGISTGSFHHLKLAGKHKVACDTGPPNVSQRYGLNVPTLLSPDQRLG